MALNTTRFDNKLKSLEIGSEEKKKNLLAIQKGWILLDAPLKSLEEIIVARGGGVGKNKDLERYRKNGFTPINNLSFLSGLKLNVILYWEEPDERLTNRDDALYSQRLKQANMDGRTLIVTGKTSGHVGYHANLWHAYNQDKNQ